MMKLPLLFLALVVYVRADVYGLSNDHGLPQSLIAINPQNGYNKDLVDLKDLDGVFTTQLTVSVYDANSEQFILGNSDPPLLALINTFSKKIQVYNLPQYGQLLTFTAYDGVVYSLIGADPDIPFLGHLVEIDVNTKATTRLAKVKIDPANKFKVNAPMAYIPSSQIWLTEIQGSNLLMISISNNVSSVNATKIEGGWQYLWTDVNSNSSLIGYMKGVVALIDPMAGTVRSMHDFGCAGTLAVAFEYQEMYHLSNCGKLVLETIDFDNHTTATVPLDASLANTVAIHTDAAYIPFGCGRKCGTNDDCADCKTCHTCRLGHCIDTGGCGAFCLAGEDCYAGVCVGNCEFNRCGRKGCASPCQNHDDCVAVSNQCQTCRLGNCVDYGNCGSYCLTPLDCYGGNCVGHCNNYQCVP